jgi:hypothetical protein
MSEIAGLIAQSLGDPKGALQGIQASEGRSASRKLLPGFGERHLPHVDISGQEAGLAISEVVFLQPAEAVVEGIRFGQAARKLFRQIPASWHNLARTCARG